MSKKYDVDYFIKKFEAIPDDKWTIKTYKDGKKCCALGHCGVKGFKYTEEAEKLSKLFTENGLIVIYVNDNVYYEYSHLGDTPKERILVALYNIKGAEL